MRWAWLVLSYSVTILALDTAVFTSKEGVVAAPGRNDTQIYSSKEGLEQISFGANHECRISSRKIECSYEKGSYTEAVPKLNNPKRILLNHPVHGICVDDGGQVKCWADPKNIEIRPVVPIPMAANDGRVCEVESTAIHCNRTKIASTKTTKVELDKNHLCAISAEGLRCWLVSLWEDKAEPIRIPEIKAPRDIAISGDIFCALDGTQSRCWRQDSATQFRLFESVSLLRKGEEPLALYRLFGGGKTIFALDVKHPPLTEQLPWGNRVYTPSNLYEMTPDSPTYIYEGRNYDPNRPRFAWGPQHLHDGHYRYFKLDAVRLFTVNQSEDFCVVPVDKEKQRIVCRDREGTWEMDSIKDISLADDSRLCAIVNNNVQCSKGSIEDLEPVAPIPNLDAPPKYLSSGGRHTCVLKSNGKIVCWGNNSYGQLNVPAFKNAISVSAGGWHTCAIADGKVLCWGYRSPKALPQPALSQPRQISSGWAHTCALDAGGVRCWGDNTKGQAKPPTLVNPTQVSSGFYHSCALHDGGVACWGAIEHESFSLKNPGRLTSGGHHACIEDQGTIICWGGKYQQPTSRYRLPKPNIGAPSTQNLYDLQGWLDTVQAHLYRPEAAFISKAKGLLGRYPFNAHGRVSEKIGSSLTRLFIVNAAEPIFTHCDSEFFEKDATRKFLDLKKTWNHTFAIEALSDIPLSAEVYSITLDLIRAALESCRGFITEDADRQALEKLVAFVGAQKARTSPDSYRTLRDELLNELEKNSVLISMMREDGPLQPFGEILLNFQSYLKEAEDP